MTSPGGRNEAPCGRLVASESVNESGVPVQPPGSVHESPGLRTRSSIAAPFFRPNVVEGGRKMTTDRGWTGGGAAWVEERLKPEALAFLASQTGPPPPRPDATLAAALAQVEAQPSRLPAPPLVDTRPETRLRA